MAWAEEYEGADVSVSGGGSSHGINALLNGEADLGDASRLMKGKDYTKVNCDESGVRSDGTASEECMGVMPTKWVVAFDVLAVITHPSNDFASTLTYDQLYSIFTDDNPAVYWDDVAGLEALLTKKFKSTHQMKQVVPLTTFSKRLSKIGVTKLKSQEPV